MFYWSERMKPIEKAKNGVYIHWDSFAPKNWKRSNFCSILARPYKICSTKELLDEELKCIEIQFIEINRYLKWIVNQLKEPSHKKKTEVSPR